MKILVVGSGGREHTLTWKLAQDSRKPQLFCAPGNAGTAAIATNLSIAAEDVAGLTNWAKTNRPDLTVIGPEAPLCAGLTDALQALGLRVFGPNRAAAQLEGSKVFSKDVMTAAGVPTAKAASFTRTDDAIAYVRQQAGRLVVKAEGLAAGKGVIICENAAEAEAAIRDTLDKRVFGDAGNRVLIEEYLEGEEASILALVDGTHIVMLASSQDHKRIFDNDEGPNTGGMGAYSPAPVVTDDLWPTIRTEVFDRTLTELRRRGIEYKGVLYAGLMIGPQGPKVLEFNCRFGDPETQVVIPRIAGDLIPALEACVDGTLTDAHVQWRPEPAVCVVIAAGGYPGSYQKGQPISGLAEAGRQADTTVFHAGTQLKSDTVVTSGGRVLGVTALGKNLKGAIANAYAAVKQIHFHGMQYRQDIGAKALKRL